MTDFIVLPILVTFYWIVTRRAVSLIVIGIYGFSMHSSKYTEVNKLSSMHIDPLLNGLVQDDQFLINTLKKHYIVPPSNLPYNLSTVSNDIGGQFAQAKYIANNIYG